MTRAHYQAAFLSLPVLLGLCVAAQGTAVGEADREVEHPSFPSHHEQEAGHRGELLDYFRHHIPREPEDELPSGTIGEPDHLKLGRDGDENKGPISETEGDEIANIELNDNQGHGENEMRNDEIKVARNEPEMKSDHDVKDEAADEVNDEFEEPQRHTEDTEMHEEHSQDENRLPPKHDVSEAGQPRFNLQALLNRYREKMAEDQGLLQHNPDEHEAQVSEELADSEEDGIPSDELEPMDKRDDESYDHEDLSRLERSQEGAFSDFDRESRNHQIPYKIPYSNVELNSEDKLNYKRSFGPESRNGVRESEFKAEQKRYHPYVFGPKPEARSHPYPLDMNLNPHVEEPELEVKDKRYHPYIFGPKPETRSHPYPFDKTRSHVEEPELATKDKRYHPYVFGPKPESRSHPYSFVPMPETRNHPYAFEAESEPRNHPFAFKPQPEARSYPKVLEKTHRKPSLEFEHHLAQAGSPEFEPNPEARSYLQTIEHQAQHRTHPYESAHDLEEKRSHHHGAKLTKEENPHEFEFEPTHSKRHDEKFDNDELHLSEQHVPKQWHGVPKTITKRFRRSLGVMPEVPNRRQEWYQLPEDATEEGEKRQQHSEEQDASHELEKLVKQSEKTGLHGLEIKLGPSEKTRLHGRGKLVRPSEKKEFHELKQRVKPSEKKESHELKQPSERRDSHEHSEEYTDKGQQKSQFMQMPYYLEKEGTKRAQEAQDEASEEHLSKHQMEEMLKMAEEYPVVESSDEHNEDSKESHEANQKRVSSGEEQARMAEENEEAQELNRLEELYEKANRNILHANGHHHENEHESEEKRNYQHFKHESTEKRNPQHEFEHESEEKRNHPHEFQHESEEKRNHHHAFEHESEEKRNHNREFEHKSEEKRTHLQGFEDESEEKRNYPEFKHETEEKGNYPHEFEHESEEKRNHHREFKHESEEKRDHPHGFEHESEEKRNHHHAFEHESEEKRNHPHGFEHESEEKINHPHEFEHESEQKRNHPHEFESESEEKRNHPYEFEHESEEKGNHVHEFKHESEEKRNHPRKFERESEEKRNRLRKLKHESEEKRNHPHEFEHESEEKRNHPHEFEHESEEKRNHPHEFERESEEKRNPHEFEHESEEKRNHHEHEYESEDKRNRALLNNYEPEDKRNKAYVTDYEDKRNMAYLNDNAMGEINRASEHPSDNYPLSMAEERKREEVVGEQAAKKINEHYDVEPLTPEEVAGFKEALKQEEELDGLVKTGEGEQEKKSLYNYMPDSFRHTE